MLIATLSACKQIEPETPPTLDTDQEWEGDCYYVLLDIRTQSDARSAAPRRAASDHPFGGEDGDGREGGINNENRMHDATFFLIDGSLTGLGSKRVLYSHYVTPAMFGTLSSYFRIPKVEISDSTQVLLAINMGDLSKLGLNTLGQVRDYIHTQQLWRESSLLQDYDWFAMSSSSVARVQNHNLGTKEEPLVFTCNVQRMMARLDWCWYPHTTFTSEGHMSVPLATYSGETAGQVEITNMRVFNRMQTPSYLIRRVTTGRNISSSSTWNYLGRETNDMQMTPTNYVVEPTTLLKNGTNYTFTTLLNTWFGDTRFGLLDQMIAADPDASYNVETQARYNFDFDAEGVKLPGIIVTYLNENTMPLSSYRSEYCTGVLFETIYRPDFVANAVNAEGEMVKDETYTRGQTLWVYRAVNMQEEQTEFYYFSNSDAATAFQEAHKTLLTGEITRYEGARCYYGYWLRHGYNNGNEPVAPMEFGIVRNNIYRIAIRSFRGPGSVTPETIITNQNIEPIIYVKPWNVRVMDEIVM